MADYQIYASKLLDGPDDLAFILTDITVFNNILLKLVSKIYTLFNKTPELVANCTRHQTNMADFQIYILKLLNFSDILAKI